MKIESITPEQEARLDEYVEMWIDIGLSTAPVDRDATADAIARAYTQAGLKVPTVEFRKSPEREHLCAIFWGNLSAGYLSFYNYFDEVIGLDGIEEIRPLLDIARHGGPVAMYDGLAIVYERPAEMHFDDEHNLHSETGPALRYSDGFSLYCWHGTDFPEQWLTTPPTPEEALHWPNIEQRRVACEMVGWDNILEQLDAKIIDEDDDPMIGTLVEVHLPDMDPERFLRVKCGTGRRFALPVPPDMETALQANAWGYDVDTDILRALEVRT